MCQTPCPKCHKVAPPAKPPPQAAGAAPLPASIETVAAATADPLLATFPGRPRAGAAPPPAIETVAAAATDPLPATFPGTPRAGVSPPPATETVAATATDPLLAAPGTLAPHANNVTTLLTAADCILRTMSSADSDLCMDIVDVGGEFDDEFDDGPKSHAVVTAESFYADKCQSVRALVILCHGLLRDDGTPAIDITKLPWLQMKRSVIRPKADELKAEIIQPSPKTVVSSKGSEMARRESNWHWIWQGISPCGC